MPASGAKVSVRTKLSAFLFPPFNLVVTQARKHRLDKTKAESFAWPGSQPVLPSRPRSASVNVSCVAWQRNTLAGIGNPQNGGHFYGVLF